MGFPVSNNFYLPKGRKGDYYVQDNFLDYDRAARP